MRELKLSERLMLGAIKTMDVDMLDALWGAIKARLTELGITPPEEVAWTVPTGSQLSPQVYHVTAGPVEVGMASGQQSALQNPGAPAGPWEFSFDELQTGSQIPYVARLTQGTDGRLERKFVPVRYLGKRVCGDYTARAGELLEKQLGDGTRGWYLVMGGRFELVARETGVGFNAAQKRALTYLRAGTSTWSLIADVQGFGVE